MSNFIDLTDAWLEWRNECALKRCDKTHQDDFCEVAKIQAKKIFKEWIPQQKNLKDKISILELAKDDGKYAFSLVEATLPDDEEKDTPVRRAHKNAIFAQAHSPGQMTSFWLEYTLKTILGKAENFISVFESLNNDNTDPEQEEKNLHRKLVESSNYQPATSVENEIDNVDIQPDAIAFWNTLSDVQKSALVIFLLEKPICDKLVLQHLHMKKDTFRNLPKKTLEAKKKAYSNLTKEDQEAYMRAFIEGLKNCFPNWLNQTPTGLWIKNHFNLP